MYTLLSLLWYRIPIKWSCFTFHWLKPVLCEYPRDPHKSPIKVSACRVQNNFRMVARHDNKPKKFELRHVSFLTSQKSWKKLTNPCVIIYLWTWLYFTKRQNLRFKGENLAVCSRMRVCLPVNMTSERSFWPVKSLFWPHIVCWQAVILSPGLAYRFILKEIYWDLVRLVFARHKVSAHYMVCFKEDFKPPTS